MRVRFTRSAPISRSTRSPEAIRGNLLLALTVLSVSIVGIQRTSVSAERPGFRFGPYQRTLDEIQRPLGVTVAPDGTIVIAEATTGRILRLDPDGSLIGTIGGAVDGEAPLQTPADLALGPDERVFVVDAALNRVSVFARDGTMTRTWGEFGDGPGRFNEPRGIAVDAERVYVADLGNDRVQVFDHDGRLLMSFGERGTEEGSFNRPSAVAVDENGNIYVADAGNNRVQKFDARGTFIKAWGDYGPFRGLMDQPSDLIVHGGEVFVADRRNHRVQVFDPAGELRAEWGVHALELREGEGKIHYPAGLAIAPDGSFAVVCEPFENRCQLFVAAPAGVENEVPPPLVDTNAHFGEHIAIDGSLLAIAEPEMHRVHVFDITRDLPIVIGTFGERGRGYGLLIRVAGLALDYGDRSLFLGDTATRRLQRYDIRFDPDESRGFDKHRVSFAKSYELALLNEHRTARSGWVTEPGAIVRSGDGETFIVDQRNHRVLVFDASMDLVRTIGGYGSGDGEFRRPTDLAISEDGETLFVVDANNHRVQAFERSGRFRFAWGARGIGEGAFLEPFGIATGADGSLYVTDTALHRVQQFDADGTFVRSFGAPGTGQGQFWKPKGIARDDRGRLYIVDHGNHRAQIFTSDGQWLITFGTGRAYTNRELLSELRKEEQR